MCISHIVSLVKLTLELPCSVKQKENLIIYSKQLGYGSHPMALAMANLRYGSSYYGEGTSVMLMGLNVPPMRPW